jgi:hypothetical protein
MDAAVMASQRNCRKIVIPSRNEVAGRPGKDPPAGDKDELIQAVNRVLAEAGQGV